MFQASFRLLVKFMFERTVAKQLEYVSTCYLPLLLRDLLVVRMLGGRLLIIGEERTAGTRLFM